MRYFWKSGSLKMCAVLLLTCQFAAAQEVSIRGIVSDNNTGTPLDLANVILKGVSDTTILKGTTTDQNGLYKMSGIETGSYIFKVSYVGYKDYEDSFFIHAGRGDIIKSVRLEPYDESLDEVNVTYRRSEQNLEAGQQQIRKLDLQRVPSPGGDLAAYLQNLPGVVASGDRGGQFFVRGGNPSENLTLIDGTKIFRPFHILGFYSVFPEEMVSNVDFYAGGFGPEYNGITSSVLDVRLRNGNFDNNRVSASVSPFLAEGFVEGPISKGKSSFMILSRGSLLEEARQFYPEKEQPLKFNSQIAKVSIRNESGTNCSLLSLRTYDRGKLDDQSSESFMWNNFLFGGRCAFIPKNSSFSYFDVNIGYSRSRNLVGTRSNPERNSVTSEFNIDVKYIRYAGKVKIDYGALMDMRWLNFDISDLFQHIEPQDESIIKMGAYGQASIPIGEKLFVKPGVSANLFWSHFNPIYEPRLQVSWLPRNNTNERINASIGRYYQPIAGIMDMRDAGSAFTAWMPAPESDKMMQSTHAILGWRQPVGDNLDFSVEGYHKWMKDIPISSWSVLPSFDTNLSYADGTVIGTDVSVQYNANVLYARAGYGYSVTTYKSNQENFESWFGEATLEYHPGHDRTHQVNLQTGVEVGNFSFNIAWSYGTGLPYSRPYGFDSFIQYAPHLADVTENYGTPRILLKRPFNGRLPDFHSLNLSAEQAFDLDRSRFIINLGAINTYNQKNLFYYDIQNQRTIYQLPIYPYASLKVVIN